MSTEPLVHEPVEIGCVHGRFQPFHFGHLEYVLAGYQHCRVLYIGLANGDPSQIVPDSAAPTRHLPESNPFRYFERLEMILGSLHDVGVDMARIRLVPFPINRPELLMYYVPPEAVHFITIYDEWGEKKLRKLNGLGARVEVLWRREQKFTTGTEVRGRLSRGESIEQLVPSFVAGYLKTKFIEGRSEHALR